MHEPGGFGCVKCGCNWNKGLGALRGMNPAVVTFHLGHTRPGSVQTRFKRTRCALPWVTALPLIVQKRKGARAPLR